MSMARPQLWFEKTPGRPVVSRQLNADVLFASIDRSSLPENTSTGSMRWIKNP